MKKVKENSGRPKKNGGMKTAGKIAACVGGCAAAAYVFSKVPGKIAGMSLDDVFEQEK